MNEVVIDWLGGNCPVQAEGTISGKPFYFRARGERWEMFIGGDCLFEPDWQCEQPYGNEKYAAGWMSEQEARAFIKEAAARYLRESPNK